jgi:hypothetical protein
VLQIAMVLHHHLHSLLQKNLWSSNVGPMLFLNLSMSIHCRHSFWRGSLRKAGFISTTAATVLCLIRGAIVITIILHPIRCIIGISGGGDWCRDFIVEDGATSVPAASSSHTYSSSLESLRMMILPSPGGPRSSRLRSSNTLLANSSSCVISGMRSSSSEERSTTGILSEGSPCSKTSEQWWREETSDGDPGGGGDPDGVGGGVETLLGDEEPSFEEE